ncbi:hypothetical protein BOW53_04225 [Solemya pervernicosa gill symbiont]|uniref:Uncharacterized protein n=1 Tax=Solemya pervernicosa gill symbiont TaxID=642797 RepID=A0A1T2L8E4_9GAMM|nr:DUF6641 family protein [Solemya pervernicosa gill symbiont]OOZ41330.1 hypothetical protein BOW53_04225 [Solemya pervernicosa gill symbiont]
MPILSKLSFVKDQERNIQADPVLLRRSKLSARLHEQLEMAKAAIKHEPYIKYRSVWVDDTESGEKVKKELPRKMRKWFFELHDEWFFQINYGNRKIKAKGGMSTIKVGNMEGLVSAIELLIDAVNAGELDKQLADAYVRKAG